MALSSGFAPTRRGPPRSGEFGYPVAAGEKIYRGGLVGITSGGAAQRVQTAGTVAVLGVADRDLDNTASAAVSDVKVVAMKGCFALSVAGATAANINQTVYATDDNTLLLGAWTASVAAGANTGNGTFTVAPSPGAGAMAGPYVLTMTAATTFTLIGPDGENLPGGSTGVAYSSRGISFTLTAGGTAFVAGDKFTITVAAVTAGALAVGILAGIENSQTYVQMLGA